MPSDRARPAVWRQVQQRELARYVRRELYPYSPFVRDRMQQAGLGAGDVGGVGDLDRLPLARLERIVEPATAVLRPDERALRSMGEPAVAWRVWWAKVRGRPADANRMLDAVYAPVHWHLDDGIPVASSAEDLTRLAELGRRMLAQAGLRRYDALLSFVPPGPSLAFWQVVLGTRDGGMSAVHLDRVPSAAEAEAWGPTVVAGRLADVVRLLEQARAERRTLPGLHTVLVVGDLVGPDDRTRLAAIVPRPAVEVVAAWAPPGVRALWGECRGGHAFHTWPDSEVVQVVDPATGRHVGPGREGEVAWTPIGWKGTAVARLATGVEGVLDEDACPRCGRTTPRLRVVARPPAAAASTAPRRRARKAAPAAGQAGNGRPATAPRPRKAAGTRGSAR